MPTSSASDRESLSGELHTGWSGRLVRQVLVLIAANVMVDTVVSSPIIVLPQMLEHFDTDQAAWLNAGAMLAGAMWAPLLGKSADIYGKRKVLLVTLLIGCLGALVCLFAPNVWVFIAGRMIQGAALAALFLTVALIRQICAPRLGMAVVGLLTAGTAVIGIFDAFLFEYLADEYGFQSVFVVSGALAAVAAIFVRLLIPESPIKAGGKLDVLGALLLGGGLAAALGYISLIPELGWIGVGPLSIIVGGIALMIAWGIRTRRIPEPVIPIGNLTKPLLLTMAVVVLSTGAYQSMLQLIGLIARISPDEQLGYGLDAAGSMGLLFAVPSIGIILGGPLAGALATRIGPAWTLAGGVLIGTGAAIGLFMSTSHFYPALVFFGLLGFTAGVIVTSGFNMAANVASAESHGVTTGLIQVMLAVGSVLLNVVGAAVLTATQVTVNGVEKNSAVGVNSYIAIGIGAFLVSVVVALVLARSHRFTPLLGSK
ncbi:Major Facilitator Superfamily protein [Sinosporangium album]|uniref:Major Facilitator Superfamily protein n=1 Tax=Sinosporangium album TaxID=504805 RepID=A0A1G7ZEQ9_9ACTN|nr:MFS transporter [Sinosporangium album]SDH07263.1 Major Facilitator Superfamily protein [Sinosporangium album]